MPPLAAPSAASSTTTGRRRRRVLTRLVVALTVASSLTIAAPAAQARQPARAAAPANAGVAAAAAAAPEWLKTSGSAIVTRSGKPFVIKGINWFGLETDTCAPHGLWAISLTEAMDRMKSWGFNTIRLPYANECLNPGASANAIDLNLSPTLRGKTPLQVIDAVVAAAQRRGMRVILDRHRPDVGSQSELWYTAAYSEKRWLADWKMLATRYRSNPTVIGFDLHNEPHGTACWGCGVRVRDWRAAATRAGDAILAINPKLLIIVEGVERQSIGNTWWGGGLADAKKKPVVLKVKNQLVYSAHDYPASIYPQPWFAASNYPDNLTGVWDRNWGYLQKQNIAPVLMGEFGTELETASDKKWLATMVTYLKTNKMSFAYWSFNPNSGDTGGLVADDWKTPQKAKLTALKPLLGAPTAMPVRPAPAPPTAPVTGKVTAAWKLQSSWAVGYVAELRVTAGSSAVKAWSVSWADPGATGVVSTWGMTCKLAAHRISCSGSDWGKVIGAKGTAVVGLQVSTTKAAPASPKLTVG